MSRAQDRQLACSPLVSTGQANGIMLSTSREKPQANFIRSPNQTPQQDYVGQDHSRDGHGAADPNSKKKDQDRAGDITWSSMMRPNNNVSIVSQALLLRLQDEEVRLKESSLVAFSFTVISIRM